MRPALACLAALLLLAGCGFRPLYGPRQGGGVPGSLARIAIAPIPDRVGQQVHNELLAELNPGGRPAEPDYLLTVALAEEETGLLVEPDDFVSRVNLRLTASFVLRRLADKAALLDGQARIIAAYNVTGAQYANLVAERDARRRAAEAVARQIANRIAVFFSRPGAGGPAP